MRIALLVLLLALPCCGGTGNLDLCHVDCATKRRCSPGFSEADEAACHEACDRKPGCLGDQDNEESRMCRNAPDLRERKLACYSRPCAEVAACIQPLVAINQQNPLCEK